MIAPRNLTRGNRIRGRSFMIDKYSDHIISQIICLLRTFNSSYKVIHTTLPDQKYSSNNNFNSYIRASRSIITFAAGSLSMSA